MTQDDAIKKEVYPGLYLHTLRTQIKAYSASNKPRVQVSLCGDWRGVRPSLFSSNGPLDGEKAPVKRKCFVSTMVPAMN